MKKYGSAIYLALQANNIYLSYFAENVRRERYMANLKGGDDVEWLDCFWHTLNPFIENGNKENETIYLRS